MGQPTRYQRVVDASTYDTAGFDLYLKFDGVDDFLATAAWSALSAPIQTCLGIKMPVVNGTNSYVYDSVSGLQVAMFTKATGDMAIFHNAELLTTSSPAANTPYVFTTLHNAAASTFRKNGTQTVSGGTAGAGTTNGIRLGSFNGGTNFLAHNLYGMIYRGATFSAAQQAAVEAYMNGKCHAY